MNDLPEELLNHIYNFCTTKEMINMLLLNKINTSLITNKLNHKWSIDFIRIKLIFKLWYKIYRVVRRNISNTRVYSNSWSRNIRAPSQKIILG